MTKARQLADLGNAYDDGALSNRNLIINGAMQVAQRGTSFTNNTGFKMDRWFVANPSTNSVSQVFDTTLNMYCMSVTQSAGYGTVYKIEDKDVKHLKVGDVVTLSYWINVTSGDFKISTNATSQVSVSTTTIDTATGWYRRSASYTLTSSEVSAITGGSYLQINIEPSALAYKITGVQLEVGDTATPFEHRSYGDELAKCQRYTFVVKGDDNDATGFVGYSETTSAVRFGVRYPVTMRASPSFTLSGSCRAQGGTADTATFSSGLALVHPNNSHDGSCIRVTGTSGAGAADRGFNLQFKSNGASLTFDAEL